MTLCADNQPNCPSELQELCGQHFATRGPPCATANSPPPTLDWVGHGQEPHTAKLGHHVGEQRGPSPKGDRQEIVGRAGSCTEQGEEPRGLQILHSPACERATTGGNVDWSCTLTNSSQPNGVPRTRIPLSSRRSSKSPNQSFASGSATVPDLCFAKVDLNPTVMPQLVPQQIVDIANSLRLCHSVDVVMEREKRLSCAEVGLDRTGMEPWRAPLPWPMVGRSCGQPTDE